MAIDTVALELKLQSLTSTIDYFVNGPKGKSVAIGNGRTVGTLATIDDRAYKTKYVQKLFDYSKLADAELDAAGGVLIGVGNIVRVFGETDVALNRLYQVQEDKSLIQIDYTDIYDLKNVYEYPYNNKVVRQNLVQFNDPVTQSILTYTVEPSDVKAYHIYLKGTVKISSHKEGAEGMMMSDFTLLVSLKSSEVEYVYAPANVTSLGTGLPSFMPTLFAMVDNDISPGQNILQIRPTWTQTTFEQSDPVMVEWFIENIDKTPFY